MVRNMTVQISSTVKEGLWRRAPSPLRPTNEQWALVRWLSGHFKKAYCLRARTNICTYTQGCSAWPAGRARGTNAYCSHFRQQMGRKIYREIVKEQKKKSHCLSHSKCCWAYRACCITPAISAYTGLCLPLLSHGSTGCMYLMAEDSHRSTGGRTGQWCATGLWATHHLAWNIMESRPADWREHVPCNFRNCSVIAV